ncbi:MAG: glycosyltransferase family 1 protein [Pseudomonadota bacterium]
MDPSCDIVVVAEPRFSGGSASALIADVHALRHLGARVGLLPVASAFFAGAQDRPNEQVLTLADHDDVVLLEGQGPVRCEMAFFHHPLTFDFPIEETCAITADHALLVAHHPPFRGDGSLEYDPLSVVSRVARNFGIRPVFAPVSGAVRRQLRSFAPLLPLSTVDWVNIFDPADWTPKRPVFDGGTRTLGRHSRPDMLKWPETRQEIEVALNHGPDWQTTVMGCPEGELRALGVAMSDWSILQFNSVPVSDFLESLDAFVYHYSTRWVEAFGRTIVEALLMERPCILDPRLEPTFGDLAEYAKPAEVAACLDQIAQRPDETQRLAAERRRAVLETYDAASIERRLQKIRSGSAVRSRAGGVEYGPLTTVRKQIGLRRRRAGHG